jgi:hypothetical protein
MRRVLAASLLLAFAGSSPASAESLLEFWEKDAAEIQVRSDKSLRAIVFCLAVEYEELTSLKPYILPGESEDITFVSANTGGGVSALTIYVASAKVQDTGNERKLTVKARKAWDDRVRHVTEKCV